MWVLGNGASPVHFTGTGAFYGVTEDIVEVLTRIPPVPNINHGDFTASLYLCLGVCFSKSQDNCFNEDNCYRKKEENEENRKKSLGFLKK